MNFKTEIFDNRDGTATFGIARVMQPNGKWREIGRTNYYREYPRNVRARTSADNLCRTFHKRDCEQRADYAR